jgi:hypothetical protein
MLMVELVVRVEQEVLLEVRLALMALLEQRALPLHS